MASVLFAVWGVALAAVAAWIARHRFADGVRRDDSWIGLGVLFGVVALSAGLCLMAVA